MDKIKVTIASTQYRGEFQYKTLSGVFHTDGEKNPYSINGSDPDLGGFDANSDGEQMNYCLHPRDIGCATELAVLVEEFVSALLAELKAGE